MALLFSSDSDSDLELLQLLSDWDSEELDSDDSQSTTDGEFVRSSPSPPGRLAQDNRNQNGGKQIPSQCDAESMQPHSYIESLTENSVPRSSEELSKQQNANKSEDKSVRRRKIIRRRRNVEQMHYLNDTDFTFRFRLSKCAVEALLVEIMPFVQVTSRRNNGVAPLHQLLLTLRFYALGAMLETVADFVGVSTSSASRIVQGISSAIAKLYDKHVVVKENTCIDFYKIAQFPRVLGAIDCTHIRIHSPNHLFGDEFKNREGFFSINVQAVCDADLKLMNVVARWPGSVDDDTIFDNSVFKGECERGAFGNRWLLGDTAYLSRKCLLTPISNPATPNELRYNDAHYKTWNTVQRAIGAWKRRFPVIAFTLRLKLQTIQSIIISTAVLHNFCISFNLEDIPSEVDLPEEINHMDVRPQNLEVEDFRQRNNLVEFFFDV